MSKHVRIGLIVSATALALMSVMLMASMGTRADLVTGTYNSTTPGQGYTDDTYPAKFIYDAKLTLNSGGSGSLWLKCTNVIVHQSGWVNPSDVIGKAQTVSIDYTVFGSSVTITIHDPYGGNYDLTVTSSGGRLSGSGQYTDISYVTNSWTMDVTKGGGGGGGSSSGSSIGAPNIAGVAGAAAVGGFLAGFAASILPAPRNFGGSIMPQSQSPLGTPYAPSRSVVINHQLSTMANQPQSGYTKPLPDVPRMQFGPGPIQFPNVEMGRPTDVQPTAMKPTDVLAMRFCPDCGTTLSNTAGGWSCPNCHKAPRGGLDPR